MATSSCFRSFMSFDPQHFVSVTPTNSPWIQQVQEEWSKRPGSVLLTLVLSLIVGVMLIYGVRQILYSFTRVFRTQRYPFEGLQQAQWPHITVFIAAHNEDKVIADCITALLQTDYPKDKLRIVPVNDRSSDKTELIIDAYTLLYPELIQPFHRRAGKPGKAAALKDAMRLTQGDIALIFDADYTPSPWLLRQLVAPFFDPEVGAVMGHVVPKNVGTNLLTRMLDLERSAGYQVDQQARMTLRGVPQYGGTVGGVRLSAVQAVGGWRDDVLAEDTDITFRLLLAGWKTVYNNSATCYEEVPEEWAVRMRQIHRWAQGHNQVMLHSWKDLWRSPYVTWTERIDGFLLLHVFMLQPLLLLGWVIALMLYYLNASETLGLFLPMSLWVIYAAIGSFSAFMQIAFAVLVDGHRQRIRLLPFQLLSFFASLWVMTCAFSASILDRLIHRELVWNKTVRYRKEAAQ
jgi:cellulose synthase/poly-beta-1,6-N-acetylglucosamine synthase-like glycosyltransferase